MFHHQYKSPIFTQMHITLNIINAADCYEYIIPNAYLIYKGCRQEDMQKFSKTVARKSRHDWNTISFFSILEKASHQ